MERIRYEAGNEHSPTDRFGRVLLDLAGDGTVRLDHFGWDGHRIWTTRVEPAVVDRLGEALHAAGFPEAPRIMPLAGARMRELRVCGEPAGTVLLPWHDALKLPGYADVFGVLDGLVEDIMAGTPDEAPP
jgi:hypothetical protein